MSTKLSVMIHATQLLLPNEEKNNCQENQVMAVADHNFTNFAVVPIVDVVVS